jgi:hypothetical protein
MLNVHENIVLLGQCEELLVVFKQLDCWLRDEDVDSTFDGVLCNGVVSGVWCEYSDCNKTSVSFLWLLNISPRTRAAFGKGINRGLVRIWVGFAFLWVFFERHIQTVVRI